MAPSRRSGHFGPCGFRGCDRQIKRSGYCAGHISQRQRGHEMSVLSEKRALLPNPAQPGTLLVPLTRGLFAIIDEADGDAVRGWNWSAHRGHKVDYAIRMFRSGGRLRHCSLHAFLWRLWGMPTAPEIDHRDGDGLNNRRDNLRAATSSQQKQNTRRRSDNTSGFKGVSRAGRNRDRWRASIQVDGRQTQLGTFSDPAAAADAYAMAAAKNFGEFRRHA